MLYLQNNVIYLFSLSRLLCPQRILRVYGKNEVPPIPNYLGIGFWLKLFMIMFHLLEQDFGQGLNQMELFQVTIAKTGRLEIILIMQHWAKVINFTIF